MSGTRWVFIILIVGIVGAGLLGCAIEKKQRETPVITAPTNENCQKNLVVKSPVQKPCEKVQAPVSSADKENLNVARMTCKKKFASGDCYRLQPATRKRAGRSCSRCEPQSLPYARCRSGIMSCRIGRENNPVSWFACEKRNNNTTHDPFPGSVLILGIDRKHGMPTGHVAYVEDVVPVGPSSFRLILSHTNYDRRCSLETRIEAIYNQKSMTLDVKTGNWKAWGRSLRVSGFILG